MKTTLWITCFSLLACCGCSPVEDRHDGKTVFTYNQAEALRSLDPAFASNQANIWAVTQLFNGLVELDQNMDVVPVLCRSYAVSDSGKAYTFHLRSDVYFHDHQQFAGGKGRKLNAFDVEYSFKRVIDTNDIYTSGLWIFKDKVLKNSKGLVSDTCFMAVNDSTFKIYLQKPFPHFLEILCMPYAFVVPRDVASSYGPEFRRNPVGTGPFKFKMWDEGNALILLKNEKYWKSTSKGESLPYLDAVKVTFTADKNQAFRSFLLGRLSFVSGIEEGTIDEILYRDGSVKEDLQKDYSVEKVPYLNTEYLVFQMDENADVYGGEPHPILNRDFRKALSFAVDRRSIVSNLRNGLGVAGNHGIVPPAVPGYDVKEVRGFSYNIDSALFYLQKSGVDKSSLQELSITVAKQHKSMAEFIARTWQDILGIKVKIDVNEAGTNRDLSRKGKLNLFRASWLGDYPDAENYLSLFKSSNFTPGGPNKARYSNEEFDLLFDQAMSTTNRDERYRIFQRMDQVMIRDAPVIVLFYDEVLRLTQSNISGLPANGMNVLKLEECKISK